MKPDNGYIQRKALRRFRSTEVVIFFVVVYVFAIISMIIPLRPTESKTEKRELTPFPTFTLSSFWNGEFFHGVDQWFADTFPFREALISWNNSLWSLSGIQSNAIHGEVVQGDEIPTPPPSSDPTTVVATTTTSGVTTSTSAAPTTTTATTTAPSTHTTTGKTDVNSPPKAEGQQLGAIYLAGNAAYEYYTFSLSQSDRYVQLINGVGDALAGKATVYNIIAPNSMGVMLSDDYKAKYDITTSDQKKAIAYMAGSMNKNVKTVEVFDTLRAHADEYIYFRTDHHWTATGAYYAYQEFAAKKGIIPTPLKDLQKTENEGFLGTFYAGSDQSPKLGSTPDTVVTYTPRSTNAMQFTTRDGVTVDWRVVMDGSMYSDPGALYSVFIGGDNPYSVIRNPALTDGSSCVVVKESYGNAFVPFLVDHYQTVHIVDYRYYEDNLINFVTQNKVQDVIFLNNIMATSTGQRIQEMYEITGISE